MFLARAPRLVYMPLPHTSVFGVSSLLKNTPLVIGFTLPHPPGLLKPEVRTNKMQKYFPR